MIVTLIYSKGKISNIKILKNYVLYFFMQIVTAYAFKTGNIIGKQNTYSYLVV